MRGEERDERLPLQPDAGHRAVGDQGGARHVPGILQHPDQQEQHQDLRQEDQHRADAGQRPIEEEVLQPTPAGSRASSQEVSAARSASIPSESGAATENIAWKTPRTTAMKISGPGHRMERDAVEPVRPDRRGRRPVGRRVGQLARPRPACRNALEDGQGHPRRNAEPPREETANRVEALARRAAGQDDGRPQLVGQHGEVHLATASLQVVRHVEHDQRRQAEGEHGRREGEVAGQVGGVEDHEYGVGIATPGIRPVSTSVATRSSSVRGSSA